MTEDELTGYESVPDNPAALLYRWLKIGDERARLVARDQAQHGHRTMAHNMLHCWCEIWGLDPEDRDDRLEYWRRAVGMVEAGVEARQTAETIDSYLTPHALKHFDEIETALDVFMSDPGTSITTMASHVKTTGWSSLEMLMDMLSRERPTSSMRGEDNVDLLAKTRELIDSITNDETLDEVSRILLVEKLSDVEAALIRARITGVHDVEKAVDGLMGGVIRLARRGVDVLHHPATLAVITLINAIFAVIGATADLTTITGGDLAGLLGLPPPAAGTP